MKKILVLVGLLISSLVAQAGPLEDLTAAFEAQKREKMAKKVTAQAATQTVVRGYLSSNSGLQLQVANTQYIGSLASREVVQNAVASLGYTFVSSQHRMDFYKGPKVADTYGFVLLVYYDTNGKASEIYLLDDSL